MNTRLGELQTFDRLNALSRERALSDTESLQLENAQNRLLYGPQTYGLTKELARRGIRRPRYDSRRGARC